jgi:predicted transcriptional regulator
MALYPLLKDRAGINILKTLYDDEVSKKYAVRYSELREKVVFSGATLGVLSESGLVASEKNGNGDEYISITQKGKEFIRQFDKLKRVFDGEREEQKVVEVKYDLTVLEQRILLLCSKIKAETGEVVPLKTLAQEVYPYKNAEAQSKNISKYAKRLEELNLILRSKENNRIFFDVTDSGLRVVREQFLPNEVPVP